MRTVVGGEDIVALQLHIFSGLPGMIAFLIPAAIVAGYVDCFHNGTDRLLRQDLRALARQMIEHV